MKKNTNVEAFVTGKSFPFLVMAGILLLLCVGCAHAPSRYGTPETAIIPLPNNENVDLKAEDVAKIMRRAGFSDQQIIDLGPDLRNQMADTGAAEVKMNDKVEAIFAVKGPYVHGSSRRTGSFVYDYTIGEIR